MINWNDLGLFEAVAVHGSFTKAAEAMHTVQSNVTARIKALEETFGAVLFERTSRSVALTPAGETFLQYCRQVNRLTEHLKESLRPANALSGTLRIGCLETTMARNVPAMINHFAEYYPDVTLTFQAGNSPDLLSELRTHKLDIAFVAAPVMMSEMHTQLIKKEKLSIVTAATLPSLTNYLKRQPVRIVVFDQGCSYRPRLERWLEDKGVAHYQTIVANTLEGIINFVEAGVGITILPADLIDALYDQRKLKTYALTGELGQLQTIMAYRKDRVQSRAMEAFIARFGKA